MSAFSSVLIGNQPLTLQCAKMLRAHSCSIRAVISRDDDLRDWAMAQGLPVLSPDTELADELAGLEFDWLMSIANLDLIPETVLKLARRGAVNFHDGLLPDHAGLNTPAWAILNGASRHGITWHMIEGGIDAGDIIEQQSFDIEPGETALSLNTRCYAAALDSFPTVIGQLASGAPTRRPQDLTRRRYFAKADRPAAAARLDFSLPSARLCALVAGLDHGGYANPLACPKIEVAGRVLLVGTAAPVPGQGAPGQVLAADDGALDVATGDGAIRLSGFRAPDGSVARPDAAPGDVLPSPDPEQVRRLDAAIAATARHEDRWRERLSDLRPAALALTPGDREAPPLERRIDLPPDTTAANARACLAALAARLGEAGPIDLALRIGDVPAGYVNPWVPVRFDPEGPFKDATARFEAVVDAAKALGGFAADLPARMPGVAGLKVPDLGLTDTGGLIAGTALTLSGDDAQLTLHGDPARISSAHLDLIAGRLIHLMNADMQQPVADLPILPPAERALILEGFNATDAAFERDTCIHQHIAAQAARTPDATAVIFEGRSLSYAALDARANQVAQVLAGMGVRPGQVVGLNLGRSRDLAVGALAIFKAGGAYVPLDPTYPAERLAYYVADSGATVILTESALAGTLPDTDAQRLEIDTDPRIASAPATLPESGVGADDLAYLMYTSGSTGRPKGVMVTHRNVSNFLKGMDARIPHDPPGVWLAITSVAFDISVLELFWTLARGARVVIASDESRTPVSGGVGGARARGMEFSLFYWGNDDGAGQEKYRLLLDGARFADANGFCAVWTPERHFHAFGGPYPNPAVTGAAVAAVTHNLSVRAGSCVVPLHHPARIAEDWAVIDNLTGGRAGLAIASGWQRDDFVLRPENTPPANKPAMFEALRQIRELWAGRQVSFPRADGSSHGVVTQPRPVSRVLPVWITTAGNPDTWREAGANGANVLTHLLGQDIDEVAGKIEIYHAALRKAGHDPAAFKVTLMLHTFLAADRETARAVAEGPMKEYLRSAAGLIRQYAWDFPAFRKPQGVASPAELDLGSLAPEEMEGILDFAFQRYFEESGLFGTVEDALDRVERIKAIGVDEVACLIDYGIPTDQVLSGLTPLAELLRRANAGGLAAPEDDDNSFAAQIRRHGVTHLQCTPSLARMMVSDDEARRSLSRVKHLMVGGEAVPAALISDLRAASDATIEVMYGPTEATIWATTGAAMAGEGVSAIGTPIANTRLYVLDPEGRPVPVGVVGELFIGGECVATGYWQRPELTAERFLPDPFRDGGRVYRTGDLVRWRADGSLDFLGRTDHQVKMRGVRIELGEIETAIDEMPGVRQAVVTADKDAHGLARLVAYVTESGKLDETRLRARLSERLPTHLVPSKVVVLKSFPLTPNGKVDRKALPAPSERAPTRTGPTADLSPRGSAALIAAIWGELLGVDGIGARDNFFDLGGHSLLAVEAHRAIRAKLSIDALSITDIFRYPVLDSLAARVDELVRVQFAPARPTKAPPPRATNDEAAVNQQRRAEAMARRRAMRAARVGR